MAELPPHSRQDTRLEGEFPGTRVADPQMLLHQPGLLRSQSAVEEVIQPAKRLLTGVAVQLKSPGLDAATPRTGMGLFNQAAQGRVDFPGLGGAVGIHQLLRVPVHLGSALGAAQLGSRHETPTQLSAMFSRPYRSVRAIQISSPRNLSVRRTNA